MKFIELTAYDARKTKRTINPNNIESMWQREKATCIGFSSGNHGHYYETVEEIKALISEA